MPIINEDLIILSKLSPYWRYTQASPKDQTHHITCPPSKLPNEQFLQILLFMCPSFPLKEAQAIPLRPLDLKKSFLKVSRLFQQQSLHPRTLKH